MDAVEQKERWKHASVTEIKTSGRTVRRLGAVGLLSALLMGTLASASEARVPLDKRPFTVVAVVDTGINPYHIDFRAPEFNRHPSTYITGFPRSAKALNLSLGASTYEEAVAWDTKKWDAVDPTKLYWVPGTNIVGAIGPFGKDAGGANFLDTDDAAAGHGTKVASLAGGRVHGPETNDVVIVVVDGDLVDSTGVRRRFKDGFEWAAQQPWIDVITNSWLLVDPQENQRFAEMSRAAVESGKLVCFASGNHVAPLWATASQGPSWSLNVGAASETTRGEHGYTSSPNDVLGLSGVSTAHYMSIRDEVSYESGTSFAAPNVCGEAARVISEVRGALGDHREGTMGGLASGRKQAGEYLRDGCLGLIELEDALQVTAVPAEASAPDPDDPNAVPALPVAGFARGGYGIVDHDSADAAIDVLFGRSPRPDRPVEEAWISHTDALRDAMWGPPPDPIGCD